MSRPLEPAGGAVLYTSQTPELAMLELLTKLTPATFGVRLAVELALPEDAVVQDATPTVLERFFRDTNANTQTYGSEWVAGVEVSF